MNKFEEIVYKHRDSFDDQEPDDGHFDRFKSKLNRDKGIVVQFTLANFLKIASIVIIALFSTIWIYTQSDFSIIKKELYSQEIQEVEFYYTSLMNDKLNEINQFSENDPELKNELLEKEFQDIDFLLKSLQNDLKTTPGDERVINAIIHHYQVKVEILNQILTNLNNIKQNKTKNHESTEI